MANNFARLAGLNAVRNGLEAISEQWGGNVRYLVKAEADHAPYVEFGTSKMAAQPYLRPAVEKAAGNAQALAVRVNGTEELVRTVANNISDESQRIVVVDTGELRDSHTVEKG